jgi:cysteine desulfurase / selenocysteine lyase
MTTPQSDILPSNTLASARSLFPHTGKGKIYLNHAGTSPLSTRVVEAMTGYLHERSAGKIETYEEDLPMVEECRGSIQKLIHAESVERIALTANTSDAINVIAAGIPWKSGDGVLLNTAEFPANVWPWLNLKRHGVRPVFIPEVGGRITIDGILDRLTPRTRLVALSAVQFLSGHRADLATIGDICRSRGIIFAVDGIQAVGAVRIDIQKMKIDALAAGGQKWQMSPHGTGFLYVSEELQSILQQVNLGWLGVEDPWDFRNFAQPLARNAKRYEGGSKVMPSLWGMRAALATLLEYGPPAIEKHILALGRLLIDGLREIDGVELITPIDPDERAGITTIRLPHPVDAGAIFKGLLQENITIALREGLLRYSPHFYCSPDDIDAAVKATARLVHASR